ncbi:MAG: PfkB family carbohydrate kinase [Actinomycetota bacterium]
MSNGRLDAWGLPLARRLRPTVAVVGHVEWAKLIRVERVPRTGELVDGVAVGAEAAGAGAIAAVQLARLGARVTLLTAVGADHDGTAALGRLRALGVDLAAVRRAAPQRRILVLLDERGERTLLPIGERLLPDLDDELPWHVLADADAVLLVAAGPGAVDACCKTRVVLTTARWLPRVREGSRRVDAAVGSAADAAEALDFDPLECSDLEVWTEGAAGGRWRTREAEGRFAPAGVPGPIADTYGCGDSFLGGFTFGFAAGMTVDGALALGARCGATCLTGVGPYERQLRFGDDVDARRMPLLRLPP